MRSNLMLERLLGTPSGATMLAQAEAAEQAGRLAERQKLAAELAALREREGAAKAKHDARLAEATAAQQAAAEAAREAEQALAHLHADRAHDVYEFTRGADALERKLRTSASPMIAAFLAECEEAKRRLRAALTFWSERGTYSPHTGTFHGGGAERSNGPEIEKALRAVAAIEPEVRPLVLEPLSDSDLEERIGAFRARLERAAALPPTPETARA